MAVAGNCDAQHLALDLPIEPLDHAIRAGRVGLRLTMLYPERPARRLEPIGCKKEPRSVSTWLTRKGKAWTASLRKATALRSVSSS